MEGLKFASMAPGGLFAMMIGMIKMQVLYADSLDFHHMVSCLNYVYRHNNIPYLVIM